MVRAWISLRKTVAGIGEGRRGMKRVGEMVVLVTGSTDGIGKETAGRLAGMGATVLVHGRTRQRADEALEELRGGTGSGQVSAVVGDLSSVAGVRGLAEEVRVGYDGLDALINNAGRQRMDTS